MLNECFQSHEKNIIKRVASFLFHHFVLAIIHSFPFIIFARSIFIPLLLTTGRHSTACIQ